ncbi:cell division protein FtsQ/DivIB [Uliginosibacterium sp. H1]|uniref:cell division protein FtsQ/DivIB n=1 Tax=Uliginosibacterium sp. H1 TaxID=3114757 RepID=UPI002E19422B|nr:cell division protein FtsQ/DivIB [Uliginosibacterium sp. H1]
MTKTPAFGRNPGAARGKPGAARAAGGFWHRPELMNLVADVLLLVASVAIGYAVVKAVARLPVFGLQEVVVTSPLGQVTGAQLEYAASSSLRGNFFTVNLEDARAAFEKLPWVRSAQLRRVWPATVELSLEEHAAVAYWRGSEGDMRLMNSEGEVFDAASNADMPVFSGPLDRAPSILARYREFDEMFRSIGRHVAGVALTSRMAWQLRLDDGMVIELGRDQIKAPIDDRLKRFIANYPRMQERLDHRVAVADLRYPSGFAVRLAAAPKEKK